MGRPDRLGEWDDSMSALWDEEDNEKELAAEYKKDKEDMLRIRQLHWYVMAELVTWVSQRDTDYSREEEDETSHRDDHEEDKYWYKELERDRTKY